MAHPVVSRDEWLQARRELLAREKAFTRMRDAIAAERRALPWVRLEKDYRFAGPHGERSLADLFEGRSQLIVQHFMFAPGWEQGCVGCSFEADHVGGALPHLTHHDVSFAAVSRAPLDEIERFKARMGWTFPWVSSFASDFNYDFHVSVRPEDAARGRVPYNFGEEDFSIEELPGLSVFHRDGSGAIFHTYSAYARGCEELIGTYMYLDLTPKGRDETGPNHDLTDWVRHHDRYDGAAPAGCCHGAAAVEKGVAPGV